MRILLWEIAWEYPNERRIPEPQVYDLRSSAMQFILVKSFGDAVFEEARLVVENEDAMTFARELLRNYTSMNAPTERWLYQSGDLCFGPSPGPGEEASIFLYPKARGEMFVPQGRGR